MAYRLKLGHAVPNEIKRVAYEQLESAARALRGETDADRDTAIHEARKGIKKTRAVLRLVRTELGALYDLENRRLRSVGRRLSGARDAAVMAATFDSLIARYANDLPPHRLDAIHGRLVRHREQGERRLASGMLLERAATALTASAARVADWPLKAVGFAVIAPGLERTYRRGRAALAAARTRGSAENFHQLRKRVKDHWYHVRLLEELWTGIMQAYEKSLKELETWLGDDHNLVVLRQHVVSGREAPGAGEDTKLFADLMDRCQHELRRNALSSAERVYAEKPRQFGARMGHLWEAWESQSKRGNRSKEKKAGGGRTAA